MKKQFSAILATTLLLTNLTGCNKENNTSSENNSTSPESNQTESFSFVNYETDGSQNNNSSSSGVENNSSDLSDDIISNADTEKVRQTHSDNEQYVYDAKIIDLDFDGENELLVLASYAANRRFSVWEKVNGEMKLTNAFGEGKVNWIDKISLYETKINDENVYLFTFSYSDENSMEAKVLSVLRKNADGYEVEHLLSRGTISYEFAHYEVTQPFAKEFYRKGWSKYDIGSGDFGDITKEEYDNLYEMYTKNIQAFE